MTRHDRIRCEMNLGTFRPVPSFCCNPGSAEQICLPYSRILDQVVLQACLQQPMPGFCTKLGCI
jgi:hypothetical protein